jgi:hypothetical protein
MVTFFGLILVVGKISSVFKLILLKEIQMSVWKRFLVAILALLPIESIAFAAQVAQKVGPMMTDENGVRTDGKATESMDA